MQQGFFLTFEGLDGSGKTTQIKKLASWLESQGEHPLVMRQPGGTPIGDRIRELVLDSKTKNPAPMTELGLMFSDRAQAVKEIIEPTLSQGRIVVCDRFTDSSEAYQGGGRELGSEVVLALHKILCGGLQPDLTILLISDFQASLARARRRNARTEASGKDEGRFEKERDAFYQRVFDKYQEIARREPSRVVVVDGNGSIEAIHEQIVAIVAKRLGDRVSLSTTSR